MKKENKKNSLPVVVFLTFLIIGAIAIMVSPNTSLKNTIEEQRRSSSNTFYILASQENEALQGIIEKYAKTQ